MTVENPHVVDFISIDEASGDIVLTITDHLPWDGDHAHLMALQGKLNVYLSFIESGELLESRPEAAGRRVRITLVHREPLTSIALRFLGSAEEIIAEAGFGFTWRHLPG